MSRFINAELKSDSDSDPKKDDNELMTKLECSSDNDSE